MCACGPCSVGTTSAAPQVQASLDIMSMMIMFVRATLQACLKASRLLADIAPERDARLDCLVSLHLLLVPDSLQAGQVHMLAAFAAGMQLKLHTLSSSHFLKHYCAVAFCQIALALIPKGLLCHVAIQTPIPTDSQPDT